jgi:hypothetical protein
MLEDTKYMKKVYDNKWIYVTAHELKEGFCPSIIIMPHPIRIWKKKNQASLTASLTWQRNYYH